MGAGAEAPEEEDEEDKIPDPREGLTDGPWTSYVSDEEGKEAAGEVYFFNEETQDTVWAVPEGRFKEVNWEALREAHAAAVEEAEEERRNAPSALVSVEKGKTAWERMSQRLRRTPLISEILEGAQEARRQVRKSKVGKGVQGASDRVSDFRENVNEMWETSQNPVVYQVRLTGMREERRGEERRRD